MQRPPLTNLFRACALIAPMLAWFAGQPAAALPCADYADVLRLVNQDTSQPHTDGCRVIGSTAVTYGAQHLNILDISDPAEPLLLNRLELPGNFYDIAVVEGFVFAALRSGDLVAVDMDPPAAMHVVDTIDLVEPLTGIDIYGSLVVTLSDGGLVSVVDAADPADLVPRGTLQTQPISRALAMAGYHALATSENGITPVDVSDPDALTTPGTWTTGVPGNFWPSESPSFFNISVDGDRAIVDTSQWAEGDNGMGGTIPVGEPTLVMIDVSDPTDLDYLDWTVMDVTHVLLSGDDIFTTGSGWRMAILSSDDMSLLTVQPMDHITTGLDRTGDHLLVGAYGDGLEVYRFNTEPPVEPSTVYGPGEGHLGGSGDHTFSLSGSQYTIWDVTDPSTPQVGITGGYPGRQYTYMNGFTQGTYVGFGYYAGEWDPYIPVICDVSVPHCRSFSEFFASSLDMSDGILWVVDFHTDLVAVDLTDILSPQVLSETSFEYGWPRFSEDGSFVVTDNREAIFPIDDADPADPIIGTKHYLPYGQYFVDHAIRNGVIYYGTTDFTAGTTDSGLRILDINDINAPVPVGDLHMFPDVVSVHLRGEEVLLVCDDSFQFISVADPADPQPLSPLMGVAGVGFDVVWTEDLLYLCGPRLDVWDVSDPTDPEPIGSAAAPVPGVYRGLDCIVVPGAIYPEQCVESVAVPESNDVPRTLRLAAARPNPFNPATSIGFELSQDGPAELAVYDLRGRLLRTLAGGTWTAGEHAVAWDGRDAAGRNLPSGTYLLRLRSGPTTSSLKVTLAR